MGKIINELLALSPGNSCFFRIIMQNLADKLVTIKMGSEGMWLVASILFGAAIPLYYWWRRRLATSAAATDYSSEAVVPKGNLGWPLIGETLDFIACGYTSRPVSFMDTRKSLYGNVFKSNILGTPIIVSTDPEVNKVVLQNHGNNSFIPAYPKSIREIFGKESILQTNGPMQKKVHGLIGGYLRSPQFKARIAKDIEDSVKFTLDTWKDMPVVYVQDEIKKMTFKVLVKALISVGPGEDLEFVKSEFEQLIKGLICFPIKVPGTILYKSLKARERLLKFVRRKVDERKSKTTTEGPLDAVDVLLGENEQRLSLDFISGNVLEMMIPGEETVPTAMTLAVKFLSDYPLALAQLTEENLVLKRQKQELGEEYTWTDYVSLPFTQNVISETLRMANIINGVWRKALKNVEIKGHLIPKGWCVLASFTSVHMNEDNYQHPYEFNPWRWEQKGASVNNICYTPFGGGQRLCPGLELSRLEISIFLHHLVTTYKWSAEKDDIVYFPTVKMKRKMPITVTAFNR
ncbi:3-epi-6-deoxocathasterone 23-monooxygenase CYP90C1 [Linum grandiflorum]